jgi:DNA (cytosine-5)-methyltransferase 1
VSAVVPGPEKPRLLDLFCGAGGAAVGYARAGFDVVGVDVKRQPNYPFDFIQGDALWFLETHGVRATLPQLGGRDFDAIHASPPCQAYSIANNIHGRKDHPRLIEPTREALIATGLPYIIENVPGAPLINPVTICGLALGLNVKRHRLFETNFPLLVPPCPPGHPGDWLLVFGHTVLERGHEIRRTAKNGPVIRRKHTTTERGREAMGIDWMTRDELSESIPPTYTELIGRELMAQIERKVAA